MSDQHIPDDLVAPAVEFREFQKIPRLNREVVITEKIDGTNACVVIDDWGGIKAQSRSRFISRIDDNYGFAKWVEGNATELEKLGVGYHYGEWWGQGINRGYGLTEKRFSLFNVTRWSESRPECCHVVPVIMRGTASQGFTVAIPAMMVLRAGGSLAAPGFMKPEGIVAFHTQGNLLFKATLERDEEWKGKARG